MATDGQKSATVSGSTSNYMFNPEAKPFQPENVPTTSLNIAAAPFVPNHDAAPFVPSFYHGSDIRPTRSILSAASVPLLSGFRMHRGGNEGSAAGAGTTGAATSAAAAAAVSAYTADDGSTTSAAVADSSVPRHGAAFAEADNGENETGIDAAAATHSSAQPAKHSGMYSSGHHPPQHHSSAPFAFHNGRVPPGRPLRTNSLPNPSSFSPAAAGHSLPHSQPSPTATAMPAAGARGTDANTPTTSSFRTTPTLAAIPNHTLGAKTTPHMLRSFPTQPHTVLPRPAMRSRQSPPQSQPSNYYTPPSMASMGGGGGGGNNSSNNAGGMPHVTIPSHKHMTSQVSSYINSNGSNIGARNKRGNTDTELSSYPTSLPPGNSVVDAGEMQSNSSDSNGVSAPSTVPAASPPPSMMHNKGKVQQQQQQQHQHQQQMMYLHNASISRGSQPQPPLHASLPIKMTWQPPQNCLMECETQLKIRAAARAAAGGEPIPSPSSIAATAHSGSSRDKSRRNAETSTGNDGGSASQTEQQQQQQQPTKALPLGGNYLMGVSTMKNATTPSSGVRRNSAGQQQQQQQSVSTGEDTSRQTSCGYAIPITRSASEKIAAAAAAAAAASVVQSNKVAARSATNTPAPAQSTLPKQQQQHHQQQAPQKERHTLAEALRRPHMVVDIGADNKRYPADGNMRGYTSVNNDINNINSNKLVNSSNNVTHRISPAIDRNTPMMSSNDATMSGAAPRASPSRPPAQPFNRPAVTPGTTAHRVMATSPATLNSNNNTGMYDDTYNSNHNNNNNINNININESNNSMNAAGNHTKNMHMSRPSPPYLPSAVAARSAQKRRILVWAQPQPLTFDSVRAWARAMAKKAPLSSTSWTTNAAAAAGGRSAHVDASIASNTASTPKEGGGAAAAAAPASSAHLLSPDHPLVVLIFGCRGSGKSTQSLALAERYNLLYLCSGTLVKEGKSPYVELRSSVLRYFSKQSSERGRYNGIVLDRFVAHSEADGYYVQSALSAAQLPVPLAFWLRLDPALALERAVARKDGKPMSDFRRQEERRVQRLVAERVYRPAGCLYVIDCDKLNAAQVLDRIVATVEVACSAGGTRYGIWSSQTERHLPCMTAIPGLMVSTSSSSNTKVGASGVHANSNATASAADSDDYNNEDNNINVSSNNNNSNKSSRDNNHGSTAKADGSSSGSSTAGKDATNSNGHFTSARNKGASTSNISKSTDSCSSNGALLALIDNFDTFQKLANCVHVSIGNIDGRKDSAPLSSAGGYVDRTSFSHEVAKQTLMSQMNVTLKVDGQRFLVAQHSKYGYIGFPSSFKCCYDFSALFEGLHFAAPKSVNYEAPFNDSESVSKTNHGVEVLLDTELAMDSDTHAVTLHVIDYVYFYSTNGHTVEFEKRYKTLVEWFDQMHKAQKQAAGAASSKVAAALSATQSRSGAFSVVLKKYVPIHKLAQLTPAFHLQGKNVDGIIFQHNRGYHYGLNVSLLKWKPQSLCTADFRLTNGKTVDGGASVRFDLLVSDMTGKNVSPERTYPGAVAIFTKEEIEEHKLGESVIVELSIMDVSHKNDKPSSHSVVSSRWTFHRRRDDKLTPNRYNIVKALLDMQHLKYNELVSLCAKVAYSGSL